MEYKLERLERRLVCPGRALDFMRDTVRLPDDTVEEWDFVHHKKGGGACVVPVLGDGRILMVRQVRPALGMEMLELPAGARDAEDPDASVTALRELREETGYSAGRLQPLCTLHTAVAFFDEVTEVFLAEELHREGDQHTDAAEDIRMEAWELGDLHRLIREGKLTDAKTVAGLLAYMAYQTDGEKTK